MLHVFADEHDDMYTPRVVHKEFKDVTAIGWTFNVQVSNQQQDHFRYSLNIGHKMCIKMLQIMAQIAVE